MLIIGMVAGVSIYLIYHQLAFLHPAGPVLLRMCKIIQPLLLSVMLFLSFIKIEPQNMRPHRWMIYLMMVQGGGFALLSLVLVLSRGGSSAFASWIMDNRLLVETGMLCLICPTATACAVVTGRLGGSMAGVVTYTILINLLVAILVPSIVPFIYPQEGIDFGTAFSRILAKVFPLLIMPCLCAWLVRYLLPKLHKLLLDYTHWSFYIWAFSLTLAILMSTRAIYHSGQSAGLLIGIAAVSLFACVLQFWTGKLIGSVYGCKITAGQSLGQKNTVFAIWMGYTFFDPVISVAGGFYSLWHNFFNTWQLYKRRKYLEIGSFHLGGPKDYSEESDDVEKMI